ISSARPDGAGQSSTRRADPAVGAASPAAIFARVDFPAPVVPTTATTFPGATVRSTPRSTWFCSPGSSSYAYQRSVRTSPVDRVAGRVVDRVAGRVAGGVGDASVSDPA